MPQVLVTHRPEATTALLMQLCTPGERDSDWVTQVAEFAHIYSERCCLLQTSALITAGIVSLRALQGRVRRCSVLVMIANAKLDDY